MATARLPLFYRQVMPLSRERHRDWFIDPDQGYAFAARTNSVYIAASEFRVAAREFALVFARGAADELVPNALLGLRDDENLMVDASGTWTARYVPAYVRRYPCVLAAATPDAGEFTVCIDEAYSGFNTAREGEPLLTTAGTAGTWVANSVKFLQEFHRHTLATRQFCQALDGAGLLEPMQARIDLENGASLTLGGLSCVSRTRLATLPTDVVQTFFANGYLELIYLHLHSLANLDQLMQRAVARWDHGSAERATGATPYAQSRPQ